LTKKEIKEELDYYALKYNTYEFIENDPISIVHQFSRKVDIEIIGLLIATISWGNRKSIINNGLHLLKIMNHQPFEFVMNYKESEINCLKKFKHRTFNSFDLHFFILRTQEIYRNQGGLEKVFTDGFKISNKADQAINYFRKCFIPVEFSEIRTHKHVANPLNGSAAKRINMFLRWMVRRDNNKVDFGLWKDISTSFLSCPLDIHSGRTARSYNLIKRKQNDHKAVVELDKALLILDPEDPVKYDFALFGLGIENKIKSSV
jgi:uncharacterized protein (TIGR02757 family)